MQKDGGIWGGRIAIILPYIVGGSVYGLARVGKNTGLIVLIFIGKITSIADTDKVGVEISLKSEIE